MSERRHSDGKFPALGGNSMTTYSNVKGRVCSNVSSIDVSKVRADEILYHMVTERQFPQRSSL